MRHNLQSTETHEGRVDLELCSLPSTADVKKLEKRICGENRHGRLCGRCVQNKSVYYHSDNFTCGDTTSCQYGILIYIASELLPVTIIFLIILLFNISLTSGAVYSFVFYVQILSRLNVTAFGTIHIKDHFTRGAVDFFRSVLGENWENNIILQTSLDKNYETVSAIWVSLSSYMY